MKKILLLLSILAIALLTAACGKNSEINNLSNKVLAAENSDAAESSLDSVEETDAAEPEAADTETEAEAPSETSLSEASEAEAGESAIEAEKYSLDFQTKAWRISAGMDNPKLMTAERINANNWVWLFTSAEEFAAGLVLDGANSERVETYKKHLLDLYDEEFFADHILLFQFWTTGDLIPIAVTAAETDGNSLVLTVTHYNTFCGSPAESHNLVCVELLKENLEDFRTVKVEWANVFLGEDEDPELPDNAEYFKSLDEAY